MTFLPIAQRELRVAARHKATHRWRVFFAIGAAILAIGVGLVAYQTRSFFNGQAGVWIFTLLEWIAFVVACAAGVFLTSDCVSEEKREGTLGLLFLTDLRGYDVAFGKLFATSLRPFYSLLAIFPIMALSFVLGGIPSHQFWLALVAIFNTLFFSLALGLALSTISRDAIRAMTATGLLMLAFLFLPRKLYLSFAHFDFAWLSPAFAFTNAASFRVAPFWASIVVLHLLGWVFLALASWLTPRTWQQKSSRESLKATAPFRRFLGPSGAPKLRAQDPVAWIIARDRWAAGISRILVALTMLLLVFSVAEAWKQNPAATSQFPSRAATANAAPMAITNGGVVSYSYSYSTSTTNNTTTSVVAYRMTANSIFFHLATMAASLLGWLLELWLAVQIARFYIESKRSGFLELLLVTPTTPKDLVRSHWRALGNMFFLPVAAQIVLTIGMGAVSSVAAPLTAMGFPPGMQVLTVVLSVLTWASALLSIAWFAIWLGVSSKSLTTAVLKILCYTKLLPWMGVAFGFGISAFFLATLVAGSSAGFAPMLFVAIPQILVLLINVILIAVARNRVPKAFQAFITASRL